MKCAQCGYELKAEEVGKACPRCLLRSFSDASTVEEGTASDILGLGRYRVGDKIGEGGGGQVFSLRDGHLDRTIALKRLVDEDPGDERVARFIREAKIMSRLDHPGVAPIYDLEYDDEDRPYYCMKLIRGQNLGEKIATWRSRNGEGSVGEMLAIFSKLCDTVAYAHDQRVIHRDLKPENIMVGEYGEVCVLDWGLAKDLDEEEEVVQNKREASDVMSTREGQVMGTPMTMSPEQMSGDPKRTDQRSDIFALGAILYHMLHLRPPWPDKVPQVLMKRVLSGELPEAGRQFPHIHHGRGLGTLQAMAFKAMAHRPEGRYQKVQDMRNDIAAFQDGRLTSVEARNWIREAAYWMRRNRTTSLLLSLVALLVVFSLVYILRYSRSQSHLRDLQTRVESESRREWIEVFREDFSRGFFEDRWQLVSRGQSRGEVVNGELRLKGGQTRMLYLSKALKGDLRIEFESMITGPVLGDISVFMNSPIHARSPDALKPGGYLFQFGAFGNSRAIISKRDPVLKQSLWLGSKTGISMERGRRYRMRVQRKGKSLELWVDGNLVLAAEDEKSLALDRPFHLGFYSLQSEVSYDKIRVFRLGDPQKVDMLEVAENLLFNSQFHEARTLFQVLSQNTSDTTRNARIRRQLEYCRFNSYDKALRASGLSDYRLTLTQVSGLSLELKDPKLQTLPDSILNIPLDHLSLEGSGIRDIKKLARMNLRSLNLNHSRVEDLAPLRGMQLRELQLSGTGVRDIGALSGLPLRVLNLSRTRVESLLHLKGMKLETLDLSHTPIVSFEALRGMPLVRLDLSHTRITNISVLKGMPLRALLIAQTVVKDLEPIKKSPLNYLNLGKSQVSDLSSLRGVPLKILDARETNVVDLGPLSGMQLQRLNLNHCPVDNLQALRDNPLVELNLFKTKVDDLAALRAMPIYTLDIRHTRVASLKALKDSPLGYLVAGHTRISDLNPVRTCPLIRLSIPETRVSDLSPLKEMRQLSSLDIRATQVDDLRVLQELELEDLVVDEKLLERPGHGFLMEIRGLRRVK